MAFFAWDDKFKTGIAEVDAQHKRLVAMVNDFYDAMQAGKADAVLGQLVNQLVVYTKTHFATEERMMLAKSYAAYPAHKAEHDAFTAKVSALQAQVSSKQATLSVETGRFLKDWLQKHILGTDQKYVPSLK